MINSRVATIVSGPIVRYGAASARPPASTFPYGSVYCALDTSKVYVTDGATTWTEVANDAVNAGVLTGLASARPAAGSVIPGTMYYATDTNGGTLYESDGVSTWTQMGAPVTLPDHSVTNAKMAANAATVTGTLAARPAASTVVAGTTYIETDAAGALPFASGGNVPTGRTFVSDGTNWLLTGEPVVDPSMRSLPYYGIPYMFLHPGSGAAGLQYTLNTNAKFMFSKGQSVAMQSSLSVTLVSNSGVNYIWAVPTASSDGQAITAVTLQANTTGLVISSSYGAGVLVAVVTAGVSTFSNVSNAPGGIVAPGRVFAEASLGAASAGAGDKLSISVWGDGQTPMIVEAAGTMATTSAGAGIQLIVRDGASGTGTVYAAGYGNSPVANANQNASSTSHSIAAWSGLKTFFANLGNAAGTPTLFSAADNAPSILRAKVGF